KLDDHEKAEALIVVEESASPGKCKKIVSDQKEDGCIELSDTKAALKQEDVWKDKYDKARNKNAEKELKEYADNYVVDNCIKKVIKDKKRNAVATVQEPTTPEKCDDIVSNQKDDGSFEVNETICKEIDIPATETGLTISYLNIAAPHHKKQWEDKSKKAHDYLSKQIGDADAEKELLDCTNKFVVDKITDKVIDEKKRDEIDLDKTTDKMIDEQKRDKIDHKKSEVEESKAKVSPEERYSNKEIYEDKSLGNYHFEVNRDFVKEISEGIYEGTQNDIDIAKFFSLEPLPLPTPDFLSNLKENPFNLSTLCVTIALQAPNGSFPPSNTLANLFGYETPLKLFDLYKSHCCEDRILNIDKLVWTSSMTIWFLKSMLKEYRREWASIYERAKQYINNEVHCDQEIEKIVLGTGGFNIR
ncbi:25093_t:CDS:2, partial [Racocetra persica]